MFYIRQSMSRAIACLISVALIATSSHVVEAASSQNQTPELIERIAIPRNLGYVTDLYLAEGRTAVRPYTSSVPPLSPSPALPLVVLIQDLHLHYPTQKRIVAILDHLYAKGLVSGPLAMEGVEGPYDTSKIASYPEGKIKSELVDYFMKKGELSAPEAFSVLKGNGHLLYGVDKAQYYDLNRNLFKASREDRNALRAQLTRIQSGLDLLKRKHYPYALRHLDKEEAYGMASAEKLLNEKLALCPDEMTRNLVTADHMLRLTQRLVRQEVTLEEARYVAQRLPAFVSLTNDLLKADAKAASSPAGTGGGPIMMGPGQGNSGATASSIQETLKSAVDFYLVALMRNEPMADNTLKLLTADKAITAVSAKTSDSADTTVKANTSVSNKKSAPIAATGFTASPATSASPAVIASPAAMVLVAGGFHTAGLTKAFKAAGVSYVVITPAVPEAPDASYHELYEKRLAGGHISEAEVVKDLHLKTFDPTSDASFSSEEDMVAVPADIPFLSKYFGWAFSLPRPAISRAISRLRELMIRAERRISWTAGLERGSISDKPARTSPAAVTPNQRRSGWLRRLVGRLLLSVQLAAAPQVPAWQSPRPDIQWAEPASGHKDNLRRIMSDVHRWGHIKMDKAYLDDFDVGLAWFIDRLTKSTAGVRGTIQVEPDEARDIMGGKQLSAGVIFMIAQAYADYINSTFPSVQDGNKVERAAFVGFDPRFFSKEFAEIFTRVFVANGIKVYRDREEGKTVICPTATPVSSYMAYYHHAASAIEITSSHNRFNQNGVKSQKWTGGVDIDNIGDQVAARATALYEAAKAGKEPLIHFGDLEDPELVGYVDAKKIYFDNYWRRLFPPERMKRLEDKFRQLNSKGDNAKVMFDALCGVGAPTLKYYLELMMAPGSGYDLDRELWLGNMDKGLPARFTYRNDVMDPYILKLDKPDPSSPATIAAAGSLKALVDDPDILELLMADMDSDRTGTAFPITKEQKPVAERLGLLVTEMKGGVYIVRFSANQFLTLMAYGRALEAVRTYLGLADENVAGAALRGELPLTRMQRFKLYVLRQSMVLITTVPSSMITTALMRFLRGSAINCCVGFKYLGDQAFLIDKTSRAWWTPTTLPKLILNPIKLLAVILFGATGIIISLLEESGGGQITPVGEGLLWDKNKGMTTHEDKDTLTAGMESFYHVFRLRAEGRNIIDYYKEMADSLGGVLYFYHRDDGAIPSEKEAAKTENWPWSLPLKAAIAKKAEALEACDRQTGETIVHLLEKAFPGQPPKVLKTEPTVIKDAVFLLKQANDDNGFWATVWLLLKALVAWAFGRHLEVGGTYANVRPKGVLHTLSNGWTIQTFHIGTPGKEGPAIRFFNEKGVEVLRTCFRQSGTEPIVRLYKEILQPIEGPKPLDLFEVFQRLSLHLEFHNYARVLGTAGPYVYARDAEGRIVRDAKDNPVQVVGEPNYFVRTATQLVGQYPPILPNGVQPREVDGVALAESVAQQVGLPILGYMKDEGGSIGVELGFPVTDTADSRIKRNGINTRWFVISKEGQVIYSGRFTLGAEDVTPDSELKALVEAGIAAQSPITASHNIARHPAPEAPTAPGAPATTGNIRDAEVRRIGLELLGEQKGVVRIGLRVQPSSVGATLATEHRRKAADLEDRLRALAANGSTLAQQILDLSTEISSGRAPKGQYAEHMETLISRLETIVAPAAAVDLSKLKALFDRYLGSKKEVMETTRREGQRHSPLDRPGWNAASFERQFLIEIARDLAAASGAVGLPIRPLAEGMLSDQDEQSLQKFLGRSSAPAAPVELVKVFAQELLNDRSDLANNLAGQLNEQKLKEGGAESIDPLNMRNGDLAVEVDRAGKIVNFGRVRIDITTDLVLGARVSPVRMSVHRFYRLPNPTNAPAAAVHRTRVQLQMNVDALHVMGQTQQNQEVVIEHNSVNGVLDALGGRAAAQGRLTHAFVNGQIETNWDKVYPKIQRVMLLAGPGAQPPAPADAPSWSVSVAVPIEALRRLGRDPHGDPHITLNGRGPLTGRALAVALRQLLIPMTEEGRYIRFSTLVNGAGVEHDTEITDTHDLSMVVDMNAGAADEPAPAAPAPSLADLVQAIRDTKDKTRAEAIGRSMSEDMLVRQGATRIQPGEIRHGDLLALVYGENTQEYEGRVAQVGEFRMHRGATRAHYDHIGRLYIGNEAGQGALLGYRIYRLPEETSVSPAPASGSNVSGAETEAAGPQAASPAPGSPRSKLMDMDSPWLAAQLITEFDRLAPPEMAAAFYTELERGFEIKRGTTLKVEPNTIAALRAIADRGQMNPSDEASFDKETIWGLNYRFQHRFIERITGLANFREQAWAHVMSRPPVQRESVGGETVRSETAPAAQGENRKAMWIPVLAPKGGLTQSRSVSEEVVLTRNDIPRFDAALRDPSDTFDEKPENEAAILRQFRDAFLYSFLTLRGAMGGNGLTQIVLTRGKNNIVGETVFEGQTARIRIHEDLQGLGEVFTFLEEVAWLKKGRTASQVDVTVEAMLNFLYRLYKENAKTVNRAFYSAVRSLDLGVTGGIGAYMARKLLKLSSFDNESLSRVVEQGLAEVNKRHPHLLESPDGSQRHATPVPAAPASGRVAKIVSALGEGKTGTARQTAEGMTVDELVHGGAMLVEGPWVLLHKLGAVVKDGRVIDVGRCAIGGPGKIFHAGSNDETLVLGTDLGGKGYTFYLLPAAPESNLDRARKAGTKLCYDFFGNISMRIIERAHALGYRDFTMNPFSTGTYARHLTALIAPEGQALAQRVRETTAGDWQTLRSEIMEGKTPAHLALQAALEPHPGVIAAGSAEELAEVKLVLESMTADAKDLQRDLQELKSAGRSAIEVYWILTRRFAERIAARLHADWTSGGHQMGRVSIEVDPQIDEDEYVARQIGGKPSKADIEEWKYQTIRAQATSLHEIAPNVLVKVPATPAGLRAMADLPFGINATLVFTAEDAQAVINARRGQKEHATIISPFYSRAAVYAAEHKLQEIYGLDGEEIAAALVWEAFVEMGPEAGKEAYYSSLGVKGPNTRSPSKARFGRAVIGSGWMNTPPEVAAAFNAETFEVTPVLRLKDGDRDRTLADHLAWWNQNVLGMSPAEAVARAQQAAEQWHRFKASNDYAVMRQTLQTEGVAKFVKALNDGIKALQTAMDAITPAAPEAPARVLYVDDGVLPSDRAMRSEAAKLLAAWGKENNVAIVILGPKDETGTVGDLGFVAVATRHHAPNTDEILAVLQKQDREGAIFLTWNPGVTPEQTCGMPVQKMPLQPIAGIRGQTAASFSNTFQQAASAAIAANPLPAAVHIGPMSLTGVDAGKMGKDLDLLVSENFAGQAQAAFEGRPEETGLLGKIGYEPANPKKAGDKPKNRMGWWGAARSLLKDGAKLLSAEHRSSPISIAKAIMATKPKYVIFSGMGGSSLAIITLLKVFGIKTGVHIYTLDTTDPTALLHIQQDIFEKATGNQWVNSASQIARLTSILQQHAQVIGISKSAKTTETLSHMNFFANFGVPLWMLTDPPAGQDPESEQTRQSVAKMLALDKGLPFNLLVDPNRIFWIEPDGGSRHGGRFSAPGSNVYLLAAALAGRDPVRELENSLHTFDPDNLQNDPYIWLASFLNQLDYIGKDKVTFVVSKEMEPIIRWAEQLFQESLGKKGRGFRIVFGENLKPEYLADPADSDRVFVRLSLPGDKSADRLFSSLKEKGYATADLALTSIDDLPSVMFGFQRTVAAYAYLQNRKAGIENYNFVDQDAVEFYKIAMREIMAAAGEGPVNLPSLDEMKVKSSYGTRWRLNVDELIANGVLSDDELNAQLQEIGGNRANAADVYAAALILASKKNALDFGEYAVFGYTPDGIRGALEFARESFFSRYQRAAVVGQREQDNHSVEQDRNDGKQGVFSTFVVADEHDQPLVGQYPNKVIKASALGTVRSRTQAKGFAVLLVANRLDSEAAKQLDDLFKEAMSKVDAYHRQQQIAGAKSPLAHKAPAEKPWYAYLAKAALWVVGIVTGLAAHDALVIHTGKATAAVFGDSLSGVKEIATKVSVQGMPSMDQFHVFITFLAAAVLMTVMYQWFQQHQAEQAALKVRAAGVQSVVQAMDSKRSLGEWLTQTPREIVGKLMNKLTNGNPEAEEAARRAANELEQTGA